MGNKTRVVVTGLGAITPIGNDVASFWQGLKDKKVGIAPITYFDTTDYKAKLAGEVKDFDPKKYMDPKAARRMEPFSQYAVAAAKEAFEDSGLDMSKEDPFRVGVIVGSGIGSLQAVEREHQKLLEKGPGRVNPLLVPMMISNMAAGNVAIQFGLKGKCFNVVTACATGTHSIGEAFRSIKHGYLDAAIAGGTEHSDIGFCYASFNNMHAVTRSTDVDRASIPFDAERSGFVLGDGCGLLVLEEYEHAKARGAKIYAEICGYGSTCDAYHETSPDPEGKGGAMAMKFAYQEAGMKPEDINYINAHGTSTSMNDRTETMAIKEAFGDHAKNIAVNSTKSMTGHLLGAAGGVEAVVTAMSIRNSKVHMTLGYKVPDPECDLDYVTEGARDMKITGALSNSLGFGGHNGSLLLKKWED